MSGRVHVAVVGAGRPGTADRDAETVGRLLAEAGAVVICGGLGGTMEAVCRGARGTGGVTVGILPGRDRAEANPYVDVAIPTGLGEARNTLVVRAADVVIAIEGEHGTLSEIAFALKTGTPVVGLRTWGLVRGDGAADGSIRTVETPTEAVTVALALAGDRRS